MKPPPGFKLLRALDNRPTCVPTNAVPVRNFGVETYATTHGTFMRSPAGQWSEIVKEGERIYTLKMPKEAARG
jgi:hypothetical protein